MAEEEIAKAPEGAADDVEAAAPEEGGGEPARARSLAPEESDPAQCLAVAKERHGAGDVLEALALLERAHKADPDDAGVCSWLGVLLAHERGQTKRGLELCSQALTRDPSCPSHYYHLAKVQLRAGDKASAIDVLRDGMRLHPEDELLKGALVSLGIRKPPPFKGLERSHPLNKYMGLLLARLGLR